MLGGDRGSGAIVALLAVVGLVTTGLLAAGTPATGGRDTTAGPGEVAGSIEDEGGPNASTDRSIPVEAPVDRPGHVPGPEQGIGPGSELQIDFEEGSGAGCTANFLWQNQRDRLYLGTAGHCILTGDQNGTHGPGADFDASNVTVAAATRGCTLEPSTFVVGIETCLTAEQTYVELGPVVYARNTVGTVTTDFALVCIPSHRVELTRATMPSWGGPTGLGHLERGDRVLFYGHGLGWDATPTMERRMGTGLRVDSHGWFEAAGPVHQGDSGGPIVLADPESPTTDPRGGHALGVMTEIRVQVRGGHVHPAPIAGPTVHNVLNTTEALAGLELDLLTKAPNPGTVAPCPGEKPPQPPIDEASVTVDADTVSIALPNASPHRFTLHVDRETSLQALSTTPDDVPIHAGVVLRPQARTLPERPSCQDVGDSWGTGVLVEKNMTPSQLFTPTGATRVEGSLSPGVYEVTVVPSRPGRVTLTFGRPGFSGAEGIEQVSGNAAVEPAEVQRSTVQTDASRVEATVPPAARDRVVLSVFEPRPLLGAGAYELDASLSTDQATCEEVHRSHETASSLGYLVSPPPTVGASGTVAAGRTATFSASFNATASAWTPGDATGREAMAGYAAIPLSP